MSIDPFSIAKLAMGGLDAYGSYQSTMGEAKGLLSTAELYDIQAKTVLANAEYAVRRREESGRRQVGTYVARFAKAGVMFEGSPALNIAESERNIRLDISATRLNAAARANELGFAGLNQRVKGYQMRTNARVQMGNDILNLGFGFVKDNVGMQSVDKVKGPREDF